MSDEELIEHFLTQVAQALYQARKSAGLTQEKVATALGTKQEAISRLERDASRGSISLRRFTEYALACGMAPLSWMLEGMIPVMWAKLFLEENSDVPLTESNLLAWNAARIRYGTNVLLDPKKWQIDF